MSFSINGRAKANGSQFVTGINASGHFDPTTGAGSGSGTLSCADPQALNGGGVLQAHFGIRSVVVSPDDATLTIETNSFDMPAVGRTGCRAQILATKAGLHGSGGCTVFGPDGSVEYQMDVTEFTNPVDSVSF